MQKIIEIEQHLLFFIDFFRVPKYRVRPIVVIMIGNDTPFYLSVCLSICLSFSLSVCISVCLSICLSVCRSVGLSVFLTSNNYKKSQTFTKSLKY